MALGSCSLGTNEATIAPRVGMSNANMTPVTADIAKRCHASIVSVAISTAVTNPAIAKEEASEPQQSKAVYGVCDDASPDREDHDRRHRCGGY